MPAILLSYPLVPDTDAWDVPEVGVPESPVHDALAERAAALIRVAVGRLPQRGSVHRNLAIHWRPERPRAGVDPDVTWVEPALDRWPPAPRSLRRWALETRPRLAVEVVSATRADKDYVTLHERYADLRVPELWVLDPELAGPRALGGPVAMQQWLTTSRGFERVHFGAGPFRSPELGLWVHWLGAAPGLALALDPDGAELVRTAEESAERRVEDERRRADDERRRADDERRRADAAERMLANLQAELARRTPGVAR